MLTKSTAEAVLAEALTTGGDFPEDIHGGYRLRHNIHDRRQCR